MDELELTSKDKRTCVSTRKIRRLSHPRRSKYHSFAEVPSFVGGEFLRRRPDVEGSSRGSLS